MRLSYKAVTRDGKTVSGVIEAKDENEAGSYLRSRGILPIHISKPASADIFKNVPFLGKNSKSQLVFVTRQLSSMLTSGLTLMQSLNVLKEQLQNEPMGDVLKGVMVSMEDGRPFSQAIAKYPETFSPIYVSLVKAAESSGILEKVMNRLAENLEKQEQLAATIKGALLYPLIIVIGMLGVMAIMMIFVVPPLASVYESLHVELPFITKIVIGISHFVTNFWPLAIGGVVLFVFLLTRIKQSETGKIILDNIMLKLPVFGKLIRESILAELTRTLGLLIGSGTLVVDAFMQSSVVVGNEQYKNAIVNIAKRVEKGVSVYDAMVSSPLFPPLLTQTVKIGEQTGKLDESLLRVSEYFEREVNQATKTLTTALEPFILIFLGVGVGGMIIAIITPIYSLINAIK